MRTGPHLAPIVVALGLCLAAPASAGPPKVSAPDGAIDLATAYPEILTLRGVPGASEDWSFAPFSDQGAWQGFAAPPADRPDLRGGFIGPFLMPEGRWLTPQLVALQIRDAREGNLVRLQDAEHHRSWVYPGSLRQSTRVDGLILTQRLWFHSARTALLQVRLHNSGETARELELAWTGSVFDQAALEPTPSGVAARSSSGARVRVDPDRSAHEVEIEPSSLDEGNELSVSGRARQRYRMRSADMVIVPPRDGVNVSVAITVTLPEEVPPDEAALRASLADVDASWLRNLQRWNGYLNRVDTGRPPGDAVQILAVKSLMTLVNNWRGPAGRLNHSALFPSSNVGYFNGFWAWDSWKHAVGTSVFDPDLAKEQVRAMFEHQDESGMIPDVVYLDEAEDNWRNTKPPLAGWAVRAIHASTGDLEFVRELYPKLVAYHRFWYARRDHDGDGLCEYGSTDGTVVAARWESGMDNAVRFDQARMLSNGPAAWSMDQESVDLNSYLYGEKLALAGLSRAVGDEEAAVGWETEARVLRQKIRSEMFDEETGWFYDVRVESGELVPVQGPEGWIPLWTGVASEAQAARVRETLLDPGKFRTHVPFPTVSRDDPGFSDGYWRGLVWLDQAYFAIEGLWRYGYHEDARSLRDQLFTNLEGATVAGEPLRENYHPLTGEGRNVRHFSWSAAHLLLLTNSPPGLLGRSIASPPVSR